MPPPVEESASDDDDEEEEVDQPAPVTEVHRLVVHGGEADDEDALDGCKNGGSGTIYSVRRDSLKIHNGYLNSTAVTNITVPLDDDHIDDDKQKLVGKLSIDGHARLLVSNEEADDLIFDHISVQGRSWLSLSQSPERVHLHIKKSLMVDERATFDFSETKWVGIYPAENVTDFAVANVIYRKFVGI